MNRSYSSNRFVDRGILFGLILGLMVIFSPGVRASSHADFITAIDSRTGIVTAKLSLTGQTFQFKVADAMLLRKLKVGQQVFANLSTKQVSLDGKTNCCAITSIGPVLGPRVSAPAAPQANMTAPLPSAPGSFSQAVPLPLRSLQVDPHQVYGGNLGVQGTVELSQPPGQNGVTVTLESSNRQLAGVPPSVTITHGVTSAATGPMYKATFLITTQPVQADTTVTISARAGVQVLQANLRILRPRMQSARLEGPGICDGYNKATVRYTLTGPAPSGLRVIAHVTVQSPSGSSSSADDGEAVPTGNSAGSFGIVPARCQAHNPGERCSIHGTAVANDAAGSIGYNVSLSGSCGHPPD